jgi:glyoxylase-like metal-dependent hydrolase (beta-lactamase superfamily II)
MIGPLSGANAYLIAGESLILIDSGPPYSGPRVLHYIERLGRDPRELKLIVLTHSHVDHTGGAQWLRSRTGALVLAHRDEAHRAANGRPFVLPGGAGPIDPIVRLSRWMLRAGPVLLDGTVTEGQVLTGAPGPKIVHTPGHSPGHVCLYMEESKVLFAGDVVSGYSGRLSRPFPMPGTDPAELEASLRRLADLDIALLCCAHGRPVVDPAAQLRLLIATPQISGSWGPVLRHVAASPLRLWRRQW